ncbi:MAG TPA: dihydrofolate reductase family protein [Chitinophagaceae bacterium]|nr:dihydrofolate reductase family protein [Chitinophagaceae bacterium]
MGILNVYNFLSVNGYFKGPNDDISWAHETSSQESTDFASESAQSSSTLLFGRKTYEMMASYWPSEQAKKNAPGVAEGMNRSEKIVFSKTLKKADWNNTRIVKDNIEQEVKKLKEAGKNMTILGSGSIVNLLTEKGLIDQYTLMIHPIALGGGTAFLEDISKKLSLELVNTRSFKNGQLLLQYRRK